MNPIERRYFQGIQAIQMRYMQEVALHSEIAIKCLNYARPTYLISDGKLEVIDQGIPEDLKPIYDEHMEAIAQIARECEREVERFNDLNMYWLKPEGDPRMRPSDEVILRLTKANP